jgi:hypothetical protein
LYCSTLLTFGIESRVNPEYNEPAGTNTGYVDAKDLILLNHDFIADVTAGWLDVNRPSYDYNEALLKQQIKDVAEAAIYDLIYGGNSASIYKGQQLFDDDNNDQNFLDAIEFAGDLIRNYIISNVLFPLGSPPLSTLAQFRDGVAYPNGSVAGATIGLAFSTVGLIASGEEGPTLLNPILVGYDIDYRTTRQIMILNTRFIFPPFPPIVS